MLTKLCDVKYTTCFGLCSQLQVLIFIENIKKIGKIRLIHLGQ